MLGKYGLANSLLGNLPLWATAINNPVVCIDCWHCWLKWAFCTIFFFLSSFRFLLFELCSTVSMCIHLIQLNWIWGFSHKNVIFLSILLLIWCSQLLFSKCIYPFSDIHCECIPSMVTTVSFGANKINSLCFQAIYPCPTLSHESKIICYFSSELFSTKAHQ